MRHLKAGRKFGRNPAHRRAMLRNLTANLITHERIQTTDAKAKELRRVAERLITKAVRLGDVAYVKGAEGDHARVARRLHVARQIGAYIPRFGVVINEDGVSERIDLVEKVLLDLAKRFQGRPGGYTRIIKIGPRRGDNAPMSLIEFVGNEEAEETTEAKAEETTEAKAEVTTEAKAEETTEAKAEETTEAKAEETTEAKAEVTEETDEKKSE